MQGKIFRAIVMAMSLMLFISSWLEASRITFHTAASTGNTEVLSTYLAKKPEILNQLDEQGVTALHRAARGKQVEAVRLLLKKGADVNLRGKKDQCTPLLYAVLGANMEIIQLLVDKGSDINARDKDGENALYYGAAAGRTDIIKYFMKKGLKLKGETSKIHTNPLTYAVERGHLETARWLFKQGVDLNIADETNFNLLHRDAWAAKADMILWLLAQGLNVNSKTTSGRTPLHNAAMAGNTGAVDLLLKKGADINAADKEGRTALYQAVKHGDTGVAAGLLKNGADACWTGKKEAKSLLHLTAKLGYGKITEMLISKGADPNIKDAAGKTPIHYAVKYGHKNTAGVLLAAGADKKEIDGIDSSQSNVLAKDLNPGDALVWYTGHSGWAIKTKNHFLVFDYYKGKNRTGTPCLANGSIDTDEINALNTVVFVSHAHGDHYMPEIFDWKKSMPSIKYIMGFHPKDKQNYLYIPPHSTQKIGDMEITTIKSNDSGVGFFVKVDGVAIFHPGDHANRARDFSGPYAAEIDFLVKHNKTPDLLFTPISGCGFGDQAAVKKGAYYAVKKLKPAVWFPMHAGGGEERYKQFAEEVHKKGIDTPLFCAGNSGDRFFFRQRLFSSRVYSLPPLLKASARKAK